MKTWDAGSEGVTTVYHELQPDGAWRQAQWRVRNGQLVDLAREEGFYRTFGGTFFRMGEQLDEDPVAWWLDYYQPAEAAFAPPRLEQGEGEGEAVRHPDGIYTAPLPPGWGASQADRFTLTLRSQTGQGAIKLTAWPGLGLSLEQWQTLAERQLSLDTGARGLLDPGLAGDWQTGGPEALAEAGLLASRLYLRPHYPGDPAPARVRLLLLERGGWMFLLALASAAPEEEVRTIEAARQVLAGFEVQELLTDPSAGQPGLAGRWRNELEGDYVFQPGGGVVFWSKARDGDGQVVFQQRLTGRYQVFRDVIFMSREEHGGNIYYQDFQPFLEESPPRLRKGGTGQFYYRVQSGE